MTYAQVMHVQPASAFHRVYPYGVPIHKARLRPQHLVDIASSPQRAHQVIIHSQEPSGKLGHMSSRAGSAFQHVSPGGGNVEQGRGNIKQEEASAQAERRLYGRLVSSGAPKSLQHLDGEWTRSPDEPDVAGRPHYIKGVVHLFYDWSTRSWLIATRINYSADEVLAQAVSSAEHPNTVSKASWKLRIEDGTLSSCTAFDISCCGPNTPEKPFLMEELGRDFFVRSQPRKQVIWFKCPRTGQVFHSGAKRAGMHKAGNRYCPMCNRCFSANNFKSQHLRSHARAAAGSLSASPGHSAPQTPEPTERPTSLCDDGSDFFTLETFSSVVGDVTSEQFFTPAEQPAPAVLVEPFMGFAPQPPALKGNWNISFDPVQEVIHSFPLLA